MITIGRLAPGDRAAWEELFRGYWQTHQANATARALYDKVAVNEGFIVYAVDLPG